MSTRRKSCDHDHWNIYPGNVITCVDCGESIDPEELLDTMSGEPVHITTINELPTISPLTYRMKDLT